MGVYRTNPLPGGSLWTSNDGLPSQTESSRKARGTTNEENVGVSFLFLSLVVEDNVDC